MKQVKIKPSENAMFFQIFNIHITHGLTLNSIEIEEVYETKSRNKKTYLMTCLLALMLITAKLFSTWKTTGYLIQVTWYVFAFLQIDKNTIEKSLYLLLI